MSLCCNGSVTAYVCDYDFSYNRPALVSLEQPKEVTDRLQRSSLIGYKHIVVLENMGTVIIWDL